MDPTKGLARTFTDEENVERQVIQGHSGAVYHPKIRPDRTLDLNTISPQTEFVGTMHGELFTAFKTEDINELRGEIKRIQGAFMWDGVALPSDPSTLHKKNLQGTPLSVDELQTNAKDGTKEFNDIIDDSLVAKADEP